MNIQRYVSDELTHFVGRKLSASEQYDLLIEIISSGKLGQGDPYAMEISSAPLSSNQAYLPQVTCFCDIPQVDMQIHMRKYSRFGVAFQKSFLLQNGAIPVHYIPVNAIPTNKEFGKTSADIFDRMHRLFCVLHHNLFLLNRYSLPNNHLLSNAYSDMSELLGMLNFFFFSYCKFFDSNLDDSDENNFYMEREWRLHGSINFQLHDVSRVIFPREFAARFRKDIPEYLGQITFS